METFRHPVSRTDKQIIIVLNILISEVVWRHDENVAALHPTLAPLFDSLIGGQRVVCYELLKSPSKETFLEVLETLGQLQIGYKVRYCVAKRRRVHQA